MNFSPRVDINLLSNNFTVSKLAVGAPQLPGYLIFPQRLLTLSCFLGFSFSHFTNYPAVGDIYKHLFRYLLFFDEGHCVSALETAVHSLGNADDFISKIDSPCILVLWIFLRWRYMSNSPISLSMTSPSHLYTTFNGNFLDARFLGIDGDVVVSIHTNIISCVNYIVVRTLVHVLFYGGSLSFWVM